VNGHPELQQFLAQHPGVREEYKENPNAFMRQEQRFDRREDSRFSRDRDVTNGELSSFHEFLEGHGRISSELSQNPSRAKNQEYLENHAELQTYLQNHPHVREELNEHPDAFFKSAQTFEGRTAVKGTAKLPTTDPKLK
jgi:phage-related protein